MKKWRLKFTPILLEIKRLLYEEKMTIRGARQRLRQKENHKGNAVISTKYRILENIKAELEEILRVLS
jgi:hypothetical protein